MYSNKTDHTASRFTIDYKSMFEDLSGSTEPIASDNSAEILVSVILPTF